MKELNYNIIVKSKRHLGQKVALVFVDKKRIKVHNGIMGHFTNDGIKLMIDGLISETIPFFENDKEKMKEFVPYFILFGLKKDYFDDMVSYALEIHQKHNKDFFI